jgi:cytoskeletal protein RodZ
VVSAYARQQEGKRVQAGRSFNPDPINGEKPLESPDVHQEISLLRELVNITRTEVSRTRQRLDQRQLEAAQLRHRKIVWIVTLVIALEVGAGLWFGLPLLRNQRVSTAALPATPAVAVDGKDRAAPLEQSQSTKPENDADPQTIVPENVSQAAPDIDATAQVKDSRENIRTDLSHQAAGPSPLHETSEQLNRPSNNDRQVAATGGNLHLLSDGVDRNRIDFRVSRNRTQEVAPGIYLTIKYTDLENQRIDGWLQIAEDGRTVLIRSHDAQKVMSFSTKKDERYRELVFTHIDRNGVSGYLLIPTGSG